MDAVLAATAVVASPVVWMVERGTLTPEAALQRGGICLALCWVAISVVSAFAFPDSRPRPAVDEDPADGDEAPDDTRVLRP